MDVALGSIVVRANYSCTPGAFSRGIEWFNVGTADGRNLAYLVHVYEASSGAWNTPSWTYSYGADYVAGQAVPIHGWFYFWHHYAAYTGTGAQNGWEVGGEAPPVNTTFSDGAQASYNGWCYL